MGCFYQLIQLLFSNHTFNGQIAELVNVEWKTRTTFNPSGVKGWEKNTLKGYYPGKFSHQITSFIGYYELLYPNMNGNRKASQSIDDHIVWNILRKVVNDQQITII